MDRPLSLSEATVLDKYRLCTNNYIFDTVNHTKKLITSKLLKLCILNMSTKTLPYIVACNKQNALKQGIVSSYRK